MKKTDWATATPEEVLEIIRKERERVARKVLRDIRGEWKARRERQTRQEA